MVMLASFVAMVMLASSMAMVMLASSVAMVMLASVVVMVMLAFVAMVMLASFVVMVVLAPFGSAPLRPTPPGPEELVHLGLLGVLWRLAHAHGKLLPNGVYWLWDGARRHAEEGEEESGEPHGVSSGVELCGECRLKG